MTVKYVFDVHPDDKFACMADLLGGSQAIREFSSTCMCEHPR